MKYKTLLMKVYMRIKLTTKASDSKVYTWNVCCREMWENVSGSRKSGGGRLHIYFNNVFYHNENLLMPTIDNDCK